MRGRRERERIKKELMEKGEYMLDGFREEIDAMEIAMKQERWLEMANRSQALAHELTRLAREIRERTARQ